jgi:hypothetical protein
MAYASAAFWNNGAIHKNSHRVGSALTLQVRRRRSGVTEGCAPWLGRATCSTQSFQRAFGFAAEDTPCSNPRLVPEITKQSFISMRTIFASINYTPCDLRLRSECLYSSIQLVLQAESFARYHERSQLLGSGNTTVSYGRWIRVTATGMLARQRTLRQCSLVSSVCDTQHRTRQRRVGS